MNAAASTPRRPDEGRPASGRRRAASILGAVALGAALLVGGTQAAAADPSERAGTVSKGISKQEASSAVSYWTPERMKNATSAEVLLDDKKKSKPRIEIGAPTKIKGERPVQKAKPTKNTSETPVSHIGKVFFTMNGSDYVCSANAVVSVNESTVSTAGHCLNEGPGGFASRFVFVPAYENGSAPYGTWAATELHTTPQWANQGDITYDGAFAVVAPVNGRTLTDTVGASGVAFNQARGLTYSAYGYPAARPFNGETLESCYGKATDDPYGQTQSQGIPCDMTGGSSGGPWFIGAGTNGYQNSVNSFGYSGVRNTMFGPYFGTDIQNAYQQAQS
ncbi:hypothetical protein [Zhihengliuella sp.]|uniref:trypsin-like serine peptidase n=1 Tax=Zhihengliuella sp. TaxID=1954483 RepID=UPI002810E34D|nr:hypothetical protein [Zhihengliuella sp.]